MHTKVHKVWTRPVLLVVLLLLLAACGPVMEPRFVSRCGAQFMGSYPTGLGIAGWNEEALQNVEDRSIEALARRVHGDHRFTQNNICNSLRGVEIYVYPEDSLPRVLYSPNLRPPTRALTEAEVDDQIAGLADCFNGKMLLTNIIGGVHKSAFAHELAHFTQSCSPRPDPDVKFTNDDDAAHSNWYHDGIYDAINQVESP